MKYAILLQDYLIGVVVVLLLIPNSAEMAVKIDGIGHCALAAKDIEMMS